MGVLWNRSGDADPVAPGPTHNDELPARAPALLADYIEWTGGEAEAYSNAVPPHLFAQWGYPLMAKALGAAPWPLARILNQGCRLENRAPLPADEPLMVQAHLSHVSVEPHKARTITRLVTGTASVPDAIVADLHAVVPLAKREGGGKREKPTVPESATELARHQLTPRSGLDFALLTGDFNPIHWIGPYAKMAGFRSTILHGFASMSLAWEDVVRNLLDGDPSRLAMMDVRFVRPLHLPADVGVYVSETDTDETAIHVGTGPGGEVYMVGTFAKRGENE